MAAPRTALLIIESPNKFDAIRRYLPDGIELAATLGHVIGTPPTLNPTCINRSYEETKLIVKSQEALRFLRNRMLNHENVIIATDPDEEGDRIAYDVNLLCEKYGKTVYRTHLLELNREGVTAALNECREGVVEGLEFKATRRRVVDRLVGAALMDDKYGSRGGRVSTAIIAYLKKKKFPSKIDIEYLSSLPGYENFAEQADKAWTGVETVFHCANKLDKAPVEIAAAMQDLFAEGKLSYPRANTDRISEIAKRKYPSLARKVEMRKQKIGDIVNKAHEARITKPNKKGQKRDDNHASPYPLVKHKVGNRAFMSTKDAVLSVIGEKWEGKGCKYKDVRPDAALMAVATHLKVGTAATIPQITEKLINNGVVYEDDVALTDKGKAWATQIPNVFQETDLSERLQYDDDTSVRDILSDTGLIEHIKPLLCDAPAFDPSVLLHSGPDAEMEVRWQMQTEDLQSIQL